MIHPFASEGDGSTELTSDDQVGLIPSHIATRGDLFNAEQRNIAQALMRSFLTVSALLDEQYLPDLHRERLSGCSDMPVTLG